MYVGYIQLLEFMTLCALTTFSDVSILFVFISYALYRGNVIYNLM